MVLPFYMKRALTLRVMAYLDLFVFFFLVIQDVQAMFDPSKKKKKKKANRKELAEGLVPEQGFSSVPVEFAPDVDDGEEEPTYEEMLEKGYNEVLKNNPQLTSKSRKKLKPPQVARVGTTRTAWTNFGEICDSLKRDLNHVMTFYLSELGTTGSIDGKRQLVIKGRLQAKYMESLLRKYISEYVTCRMCRSLETELTREPTTRLYFMTCKTCGSNRSVQAIRTGFQAVARGERRRARMAAQS
eukprot:gb/GECG01016521.1/.p1 GENE.gb/GECG01016521.1/~~gb/GECG01016521.1/.p1  ORF type:complete len:242 (+),score=31.64 gb/GECG01016521.1/:1-726(+)